MNYSISISLQVWHPHFTGDQLEALFNRASDVKHTVGENIVRGDGKRLPSKYVDSYVCYDIVPLQNFTDLYEPLKEANGIVLNMLKEKKSFFELKKKKDGLFIIVRSIQKNMLRFLFHLKFQRNYQIWELMLE